ncbi:hypothetical protein H4R18_002186 [Coemansia javaensis]|uniref:Uncharacterized protein n=1 Tax=Coemansia javaensis TaxID=2761396 RepID=A0A9W8LKD8_9FUNG|nr:hypothetical protein H4R18_002186 [Coemansia javaensis]
MDINRLPDVVLRMILAAAAKDGDEVGPTLAANLPLLALYGQITVAYAGQLRAIDSVYPIAVSSSCTFKQLMRASIRYDMDTSYRHLLRTLGISLEVYSAMPACPLLKHAVFPLRMDEISIIVSVPMLQSLLYMPLPTAKRLKIGISSGANRNVDSLATACRILERAQNATELGLHVHDATLPVLPESVTCTSLASLLELRSLKLANIQADISVPKPDDDRVLGPLETNIEELTIEVRYAERQWEMLVPVVKYLLLRIPTLFTFTGKQVPKMPVMKLVRAYCGKYPHLKDVEFKLCGDDWY